MAILIGPAKDEVPSNGDLGQCAYLEQRDLSVSHALEVTTTERDELTVRNGDFVYNTTTDLFNFYENGVWVVYTSTPA